MLIPTIDWEDTTSYKSLLEMAGEHFEGIISLIVLR